MHHLAQCFLNVFYVARRFAYDTDNQFRAERRYPNGTVAGYFGYIGADDKAIRVKYGAVDELGFSAVQELIPDAFPETATEPDDPATAATPEASGVNRLPQPNEPIVDDVNDSISVDAIEFYEARTKLEPPADRWRFPLIQADDIPITKTRQTRAIKSQIEPFRRLFQQGLVLEQHPGEPAIIYADPDARQSEDRFLKTASAQIALA